MLKRIVPVILCSVLFFACKKNEPDVTPTPQPTTQEDASYVMGGVADVNLDNPTTEAKVTLSLAPTTGKQPRVSLSTDNTPENVTVWFDPQTATVPFTTTLHIKNNHATPGDYDMKVRGITDEGQKAIRFVLHVK